MTGTSTVVKFAGVILGMLSLMLAAQTSGPSETSCGPPNYCARTDLRVEPYPKTPPALGPAGFIIDDPTFGTLGCEPKPSPLLVDC